jgi:hypothetical protein
MLVALGACGAPEPAGLAMTDADSTPQGLGRRNHVDGTVLGHGIEVRDALYMRYPLKHVNGEPVETVSVLLSDRPDLCRYLQADALPHDLTVFGITLQRGPRLAVNPGEYGVEAPVVDPGSSVPRGRAYAQFLQLDAHCAPILPEGSTTRIVAHAGSLELGKAGSEALPRVTGAFDFSFGPQGDPVKGQFDATLCPLRSHEFSRCVD